MNRENLPNVGQPLNGGFYAGLIQIGDETYAVITAPKAHGQKLSTEWHSEYTNTAATSYNDGKANTLAMAEADSELAKWALSLDINSFNDWYIPSRDEREIIYRHLKPTADKNCCSFRDGENPSAPSIADRYPYTPDSPAMTTAELFQQGGPEAFDPIWYWSSTQHSSPNAWCQDFEDGGTSVTHKDFKLAVRAVRRELVI
jgi:hypothetical protein